MKEKRLKEILKRFKKQQILVIGDLILDKFVFGKVSRISPEAPVPIVKMEKENFSPGGEQATSPLTLPLLGQR